MLITKQDFQLLEEILFSIEEASGISRKFFIKKRTKTSLAILLRQIAIYMLRNEGAFGVAEIGHLVGGYHHSTIIHNIKKMEQMIQFPNIYKKEISMYNEVMKEYNGQQDKETV